jgi:hypothetical protein
MADAQGETAVRQEEAVKKELAVVNEEAEILSDLKRHVEAIASAYNGIIQYKKGKVPGQTGVVLTKDVSCTQTDCFCFFFFFLSILTYSTFRLRSDAD